jgi:hypothetical protein
MRGNGMKYKKVLVVAASALFSVAAFVNPVAAVAASPELDFAKSAPEGPEPGSPCISNVRVKACFQADGDKIYIKDMKADGDAWYVDWAIRGGRWGQCATKLGAGKWGVCDKDFPENQLIDFTIYASSNATVMTSHT